MAGFEDKARKIAEELKKRDNFAVIHHYDADGICAGAIIAKAFQRLGKTFKTKSVKQLYKETIEEIKDMGENYVFVDFGSVLIDELKTSFGNNFFVLDHHQPKGSEYEFHLNPFEFGIDGGNDISGAGVTYEVAKNLGENSDLSALAVVGALGDMQDFKGSLTGKNREIMNTAIQSNVLEVRKDLRLYGRISRPLTQFLCFSSNPVLPELTANENACIEFLKTNNLDIRDNGKWVSYDDLSSENKKKLTTALILHLQKYNTPEWKLCELIGDVFILKNEPLKTPLRDAKEFSTLLNSCLVPGTEVYLNGIPAKIEDVCSDKVFSVENSKIVKDTIVKKHRVKLPKGVPIIELTSKAGRSINLTPNHELMSIKDGSICWLPVDNLKEGDYIAISKNIPSCSVKLCFDDFFESKELLVFGNKVRLKSTIKTIKKPVFDKNLGFLIGYIAGDGHLRQSAVDIAFSRNAKDVVSFNIIKKFFTKEFGIEKVCICNKKTFFNAEWNSKTLVTFFERIGIKKGKKSNSVCFDEKLLNGEKEFVSGLLSGLFASDRNVYSGGVEFSTHSSELIKQMVFLLQKFGIVAHISSRDCKYCKGQKHRLIICGKPNIKKFLDDIGFPDKKRNDYLKSIIKRNSNRASGSIVPVKEKLLGLGVLLGIPNRWSAHFTHYSKGKNPLEGNAIKLMNHYLNQINECKEALSKKDIKLTVKAFKISVSKFSEKGSISRVWVSRILKGKTPGKNAERKLQKAFEYYNSVLNKAEKTIKEINFFVNSDIHWDKIKTIKIKTSNLPEFVYDISVEKNHNYIANGIVVHNCGRHGEAETALEVCMGDRGEYYQRALSLLAEHRRQLREGIELMHEKGVEEMESFYFFDAGSKIKDSIVGIVAGMLYGSGAINGDKPIVAFAMHEDNTVKISTRGTSELLRKGLNLGLALKETCAKLGENAQGGGHKIAAGAKINENQKEDFLKIFNESLKNQITD